MNFEKFSKHALLGLASLSLLATAFVSKELLFPFITTKAFFFRTVLEAALPFYLYLAIKNPNLRPSFKNPLNCVVLIFLGVNLISAAAGVNPTRSIWGNFERMGGVYYLAHLVLLYFYVIMLGQAGGVFIQRFIKALLAVSALITLNGISGMLGGPTLTLDPSLPGRASSTLGNPIFFASFLIFPLFLSLFFFVQSQKLFSKWAYAVLAVLQLIGIFQSGTRGAVVGMALGLFFAGVAYVLFSSGKKIKLYGLVSILVFTALVGLSFAFHEKLPQGTTLRRVFSLRDSNTSARLIQWQVAMKGFKDYPFLGTGAENYYIVGNKHYDNRLYNFDRSWFDKPHNYLLEILITNGIIGFAAYMGILFCSLWILWGSYKKQILSLLEACLFLAAILTYQIQNLFVFDTIPASLMFYSFLGFVAFLHGEAVLEETKSKKNISPSLLPGGLAEAAAGLTLVFAVYLIVVTNIIPKQASRSVNYGYAYIGVDPYKAAEYFKTATSLPFNFDSAETGSKFGDFAAFLVRSPVASKDRAFVEKQLSNALAYENKAVEISPNDPIVLQKLANIHLYNAVFLKLVIPADAIDTAKKAIDLAPKRIEARLMLAQLRLHQGFIDEAMKIVEEAISLDPSNKDIRWQLALVSLDAGNKQRALELAEKLLFEENYKPADTSALGWLVEHYISTKQKDRAIFVAELNFTSGTIGVKETATLYTAYKAFGENQKAQSLLQQFKEAMPNAWPELEKLIQPVK